MVASNFNAYIGSSSELGAAPTLKGNYLSNYWTDALYTPVTLSSLTKGPRYTFSEIIPNL